MKTSLFTGLVLACVLGLIVAIYALRNEKTELSANDKLMIALAVGDDQAAIAILSSSTNRQGLARPAASVVNVNEEYVMITANGVVLASETPLTRACSMVPKKRRGFLVSQLLKAGADPNSGWPTPLACCVMDGDVETMALLYAGGADICEDARLASIYRAVESKSGRIKGVGRGVGPSAMMIAAGGQFDVLKWLIEHGATCSGICGGDALIQAVKWAHADCEELLVTNGATLAYTNPENETVELTESGLVLRVTSLKSLRGLGPTGRISIGRRDGPYLDISHFETNIINDSAR